MQPKVLALLLIVTAFTPAAAQDRPQPAPASAAITGRVVAADTGAPIRGAQVRLKDATGPDVRIVTSDDQGRFAAQNLFAGRWIVAASKNGFSTQRYGQRHASDEGKPIVLANGQRADLTLALARAGAIAGRLLDEYGEPLLGARVQAMRSRIIRGVRQLAPIGSSDTTDDLGAFRLFGLPPGTYFVSATLRSSPPDQDLLQGSAGAVTYYAGTPDVAEAQPLVLRAGDESTVTFQVAPVRSVRVSGAVLGTNGSPVADAEVRLQRLDASEIGTTVGNFGRTGADGTFTIVNVPPGPYVLTALRANAGFGGEEAAMPISVGVDDLSDVVASMTRGVLLSGTIVPDAGTALPSPLRLEITAIPFGGAPGRRATAIQVARAAGEPLTFQFPGMYSPLVFGANLPDGVMLRAIEANGVDVTDQPLHLAGPAPELRVVLTTRVTEVSGIVTSGSTPVTTASVVVFPDDEGKWNYPSRYVAFADTDDQGRYTIRRLPPGERYLAAVVTTFDDGDQYDAELLRRLRERATAFTLGDGEHKSLRLATER